jgi:hypothetical protein
MARIIRQRLIPDTKALEVSKKRHKTILSRERCQTVNLFSVSVQITEFFRKTGIFYLFRFSCYIL